MNVSKSEHFADRDKFSDLAVFVATWCEAVI